MADEQRQQELLETAEAERDLAVAQLKIEREAARKKEVDTEIGAALRGALEDIAGFIKAGAEQEKRPSTNWPFVPWNLPELHVKVEDVDKHHIKVGPRFKVVAPPHLYHPYSCGKERTEDKDAPRLHFAVVDETGRHIIGCETHALAVDVTGLLNQHRGVPSA